MMSVNGHMTWVNKIVNIFSKGFILILFIYHNFYDLIIRFS